MVGETMKQPVILLAICALLCAPAAAQQAAPNSDLCVAGSGFTPPASVETLLARKDLQKSEYETSAEFDARIKTAMAGVAQMKFSVAKGSALGHYDADSETYTLKSFEVSLLFNHIIGGYGPDTRQWFLIKTSGKAKSGKSYVGENAYGTKRKVSVDDYTDHGVVFLGGPIASSGATISFHISRQDAKAEIASLEAIIVGSPDAPWVYDDTHYSGATIDAPTDLTIKTRALVMKPLCGAIVDTRTGQTVASFDPSDVKEF
jgi:hypothetical protein